MKIIQGEEFGSFWKTAKSGNDDDKVTASVKEIIAAVRTDGDFAVRHYASRFEKCQAAELEVPLIETERALCCLRKNEPELAAAMELAARHIKQFSMKQKAQFTDFEYEIEEGLITGQIIIPVEKAAIYSPAGRFPLFSTVLMGLIPAFCAGVKELVLVSPPQENGLPDRHILAAAGLAAETCGVLKTSPSAALRVFAMGGAQAIAALALGTKSVPRVDLIVGPGNKYVAAAKRILFGEVGIDFIAGPTDVLIITDGSMDGRVSAIAAADMIAQAEHDPDACARCLVPGMEQARLIAEALERKLANLPAAETARASLDSNGLIIVYQNTEEAARIANLIAPEHLELQITDARAWIPRLKNYGSLFIGSLSAEVLGDYSAGINHTLPTSGSSRWTGGLSIRNFLKTVTTLRCFPGQGFKAALKAAEILAVAEGLEGHAASAAARL